jgi:hypothetical protein
VTQPIFPRVDEQANALRNAATLPYRDPLDGEVVRSAFEEENLEFRVRTYAPLVTLWTFLTQVLDPDHSLHCSTPSSTRKRIWLTYSSRDGTLNST